MAEPRTPTNDCTALSPRQKECLHLAAQGCTNKEIGRRLLIAEKTVKGHLFIAYQKLGVSHRPSHVARTQAVLTSWYRGDIDPAICLPSRARASA